ncbi:oxalate:formate antiporter [Acidaminobacter sp. JC074]|uniref:nitrogenase component 1 n=1 Tax=Acidaminobacter sp. JC074 TaxID=2530199 RepID=UPI001F0F058B|nr:nitrogenase component 1 [Acidaminobacter sp. JC074]MCH4891039.1 oxalate:formate antiporter [Acidaminobacter sp. JC074]
MYKYDLDSVKKLSQVKVDEDIVQVSKAIFPGTHCPLFGSLMVASYIKDLAVLNIGTEECTFYGKDFAHRRQSGNDNVYSMIATKREVTFGFQEKIEQTIRELVANEKPKALLVISTCVLELIGEDVEAIVDGMSSEVDIPMFTIKTEHFKCNSHIPGISDTLEHLTKLMTKQEKEEKAVNILGHRYQGFESTELNRLLIEHGIKVKMSIPSQTSVDDLKKAPSVSLNIVTDFSALALAESMKKKFDIPFVMFEKLLSPEKIADAYRQLSQVLDLDLEDFIIEQISVIEDAMIETQYTMNKKTFIYGNTPFKALELSAFLSKIGMVPIWVQMRELYSDDHDLKEQVLALGHDPKISRVANIIPMRMVYDIEKPYMYIGHENPMELMHRGIKQLTLDKEGAGLGFELPLLVMKKLVDISKGGSMSMMRGAM